MRIQILGSVRAWQGTEEVALGSPSARSVLGLLALAGGEPVQTSDIAHMLWPTTEPATASNVIQTYVRRLRCVVDPHRSAQAPSTVLPHVNTGYALRIAPERIDVFVFRQLVAQARTALDDADHPAALTLLKQALDLWRGPAADGTAPLCEHAAIAILTAEKWEAVRLLAAAAEGGGRPGDAISALEEVSHTLPFDEAVHARLIAAYTAVGRRSEAFELYQRVRDRLVDELGVDPGDELAAAHRALLWSGPATLDVPAPRRPDHEDAGIGADGGPADDHLPRELPPAPLVFVGRAAELAQIGRALRDPPAIVAIDGVGGVGKSALALHAAHLAADDFPDGQLYVDLRGSTPGMRPAAAREILPRLLRSLGVDPTSIPTDPDEAAGRYRSLLARHRVLVVLDNAVDGSQVEALLPASTASAVLITSRQCLVTLAGAAHLCVPAFTHDESVELLHRLTGGTATDTAAGAVAELCGWLALPLRIAAARVASRADWSFDDLAGRLADERGRLNEMSFESMAVRSSLRVGYDALANSADPLDVQATRALRALGSLRLPSYTVALVAAAINGGAPTATRALDRLVHARLLEADRGSYHLHDLTRLFAAELAAEDPAGGRSVVHAALAWYVNSARRADDLVRPGRRGADCGFAPAPVPVLDMHDAEDAAAWFTNERHRLVAVAELAEKSGPEFAAVPQALLQSSAWHLGKQNYWQEETELAEVTLRLGQRDDDHTARADGLLALGRLHARRREHHQAMAHLLECRAIRRDRGDVAGELIATAELGLAARFVGDHETAIGYLDEAVTLAQRAALAGVEAVILLNAAMSLGSLGREHDARDYLERSLAIRVERGDRAGEGLVNVALVPIVANLGDWDRAARCAEAGVSLCHELRLHVDEAYARVYRSILHLRADRLAESLADARAAIALAEELDDVYVRTIAYRQAARTAARLGRVEEARAHRARAAESEAERTEPPMLDVERFCASAGDPAPR